MELSDQKVDNSQQNKFDHIELYPVDMSYEDLINNLKAKGLDVKEEFRPHHSTYGIDIGMDFIARITREPLIEKIKASEMA